MTDNTNAQLPSMPGAVIDLLQTFSDPDFGMNDVVDVLKTDPALAGKLLKAANTPTYGATREVSELKRAAMLLGKKNVAILAMSFSMADKSSDEENTQKHLQKFWHQSLLSGVAASVLAKQYKSHNQEEAFLLGLLSRIGRLAAIMNTTEEYQECLEISAQHGYCVDSLCLPRMSTTCEELTLAYLRSWKLPDSFIATIQGMQEAARNDRNQDGSAADTASNHNDRLRAVSADSILRCACAISDFLLAENCGIALATMHELIGPVMTRSEDRIEQMLLLVRREFDNYSEMLEVKSDSIGTTAELHELAMHQLWEIAANSMQESIQEESRKVSSEVGWLKKRIEDLSTQLSLDLMTGIYNREHFDSQFKTQTSKVSEGKQLGLLFVDVDAFKAVNDTYGHEAGDQVICHVASTLKNTFRSTDIVARYGGDEFVVLCELESMEEFDQVAERLRSNIETAVFHCRTKRIQITVSIGGVFGAKSEGPPFNNQLMHEADLAMYSSKNAGGNKVTTHRLPTQPESINRVPRMAHDTSGCF